VEELTRQFRAIAKAVVDARPPGAIMTGDVGAALAPVVLELVAEAGLSDLTHEESCAWRWLCGREEPATLARFVSMVQRAHDAGKAVGRG